MMYDFQKSEELYTPYQPKAKLNDFLINNFEIKKDIYEIISFIEKTNIEKLIYDLQISSILNFLMTNCKLSFLMSISKAKKY